MGYGQEGAVGYFLHPMGDEHRSLDPIDIAKGPSRREPFPVFAPVANGPFEYLEMDKEIHGLSLERNRLEFYRRLERFLETS